MIPVRPLPYAFDALEPALGRDQLRLHYERHYARYVRRTNEMTQGRWTMAEEAVNEAVSRNDQALFDQAAQAWSHQVYFESMTPTAAGLPDELEPLLGHDFVERWVDAAKSVFGSGWVWLVAPRRERRLSFSPPFDAPEIVTTKDAELPRRTVILVMDVWEHAYYCDYPGERADYARAWVDHLADWGRVERLYAVHTR